MPKETIVEEKPVEERPKTRIVVTDARVIVSGHAWSKAVCVALSAAVQTFARIAAMQSLLAAKVEIDPERGFCDVQLVDTDFARLAIAGFVAAAYGISQQVPDSLLLADQRKHPPEALEAVEQPPAADESSPSFAVAGKAPRVLTPLTATLAGALAGRRIIRTE